MTIQKPHYTPGSEIDRATSWAHSTQGALRLRLPRDTYSAATNKCLARSNRSRLRANATNKQPAPAQFRAPLIWRDPAGWRCRCSPPFGGAYRGKESRNANHRPSEHSCAIPRVLRFGVCAARVRDQGQHQFQRRAHLPRPPRKWTVTFQSQTHGMRSVAKRIRPMRYLPSSTE
jgi:hypothetical protein